MVCHDNGPRSSPEIVEIPETPRSDYSTPEVSWVEDSTRLLSPSIKRSPVTKSQPSDALPLESLAEKFDTRPGYARKSKAIRTYSRKSRSVRPERPAATGIFDHGAGDGIHPGGFSLDAGFSSINVLVPDDSEAFKTTPPATLCGANSCRRAWPLKKGERHPKNPLDFGSGIQAQKSIAKLKRLRKRRVAKELPLVGEVELPSVAIQVRLAVLF